MAIAYLTGATGFLSPAADPQTVAFNSGSTGTGRVLELFFRVYDGTFSSVTYGGQAMTLATAKVDFGSGSDDLYCYYLVNPPTGSNNLVFDYTGNDRSQYSVIVHTGVHQTTPIDASTGTGFSSGTSFTSSLSSVGDNCWHVMALCNNSAGLTESTNVTKRTEDNSNGSLLVGDSNGPKTPAGALSQTITSAASQAGAYIQITLLPEATGDYTLDGETGALTLTGYDAVLTKGYNLLCETGSLILRGYDAILTKSGQTWTNQSKNSASYSNQSKNSASYSNQSKNTATWSNKVKGEK